VIKELIFVGYCEDSKAYRLVDPKDPNTLKWLKFTLSPPLQACSGVVSFNALVDHLFFKYTAVFTAQWKRAGPITCCNLSFIHQIYNINNNIYIHTHRHYYTKRTSYACPSYNTGRDPIQYIVYLHCSVHDYYGNINNTCYYDSQQSLMETWIN
jgi:hypothetical protein